MYTAFDLPQTHEVTSSTAYNTILKGGSIFNESPQYGRIYASAYDFP